jgi:hypothetical protein
MTQTSGFYTTDGSPTGHQVSSYTQVIAAKAFAIIAACHGKEGISPAYLDSLVGSVISLNTVRIGTGCAIVDGAWYENGTAEDVTIPSAVGGGNTRIDRIVLRITWANYECVITRIPGVDAANPVTPSITQTPGTVYDITLYLALVNTTGWVQLTDEREFASISTSEIDNNAVTDEILRDSAACSIIGRASSSSGSPADIVAGDNDRVLSRASGSLAFTQVTNGMLQNNCVDNTKIGNRVTTLSNRQGGSSTVWATSGSSNYVPTTTKIQVGSAITSGGVAIITFPVAFAYTPIIILTPKSLDNVCTDSETASGFHIISSSAITGVYWVAIGQ